MGSEEHAKCGVRSEQAGGLTHEKDMVKKGSSLKITEKVG